MAIELFANAQSTTLASSYTTGATSISVTSGTGFPSPTSGQQFHVSIFDQTTGALKLILQVTAVSGSTWTTVPEGIDANCASGDVVRGTMVTVGSLTQMRSDASQFGPIASLPATTGQLQGNRYKCTDSPYEFIFIGTSWDAYTDGYLVVPPVLSDFTQINVGASSLSASNGGILFACPSLGSTQNVQAIGQATGGFKYCDVAFRAIFSVGNGGAGVGFSDGLGATPKLSFIEYGAGNAGLLAAQQMYYSNPTSQGSVSGVVTCPILGPLVWMRIYDDGSTHRTYYLSGDGYNWLQLYQESRTANFTASDFTFCMIPYSAACYVHLLHWSQHN